MLGFTDSYLLLVLFPHDGSFFSIICGLLTMLLYDSYLFSIYLFFLSYPQSINSSESKRLLTFASDEGTLSQD